LLDPTVAAFKEEGGMMNGIGALPVLHSLFIVHPSSFSERHLSIHLLWTQCSASLVR
jgi:hypothetical protein